jgi:hypothetical protein
MTLPEYADKLVEAMRALKAPELVIDDLKEEWLNFAKEHEGEDPEELSFELELFPSCEGVISVVCEPEAGEMRLTVKAEDPDTGRVADLRPVPIGAWTPIWPEQAMTADKKIPANSHCPCGSGKKYKRCCGALAHVQTPQDGPEPAT